MAGTVTTTEETHGTVKKVKFAWASSAGGAADATTSAYFSGEILRLVTVPGSGGVQPTDNYDVVVNDADGNDVLMGAGANRSNASTQQVLASSLGICSNTKLTLGVTNAGNAKEGTVYVYLR